MREGIMLRRLIGVLLPCTGLLCTGLLCAGTATGAAATAAMPAGAATPGDAAGKTGIDHIFLIMEDGNGLGDLIGNPAAPNLSHLAKTFGLATDYYAVSQAGSEPDYLAILGGTTFGVTNDGPYWTNKISQPGLISQMDSAGISWKAYLQGLPHPDYEGVCYPARCGGAPGTEPLYSSAHDGIQNFTGSWNIKDWDHQVPIGELATDLGESAVPKFSYVVPDLCDDMHGDPPYCPAGGTAAATGTGTATATGTGIATATGTPTGTATGTGAGTGAGPENEHLIAVGDAYLGQLVSEITSAPFWASSNNAIIVTFDNGDGDAGCCDADPGGGRVPAIVITSHGPRGVTYAGPANHYSVLSSVEHAFGIGCLAHTCDTANVPPLTPLLAVTGSAAIATTPLPERDWPTPTPGSPPEPRSTTPAAPNRAGWYVQHAQLLGTSDNSLGAIAGTSPDSVWAFGDFQPDAAGSDPDATLTLAEHYNGKSWTVVRTPDTGPGLNVCYGAAASGGFAWAVGAHLDNQYQDRALIEVWNGSRWYIAANPQPGSVRDLLFGVSAISPSDVWAVGERQGPDGIFGTLAEHWNGHRWSVTGTPDPGTTGDHLYAVDATSPADVWAVGQRLGSRAPDQGLVEHWAGSGWQIVHLPVLTASVLLDAVTVSGGQVWVAGQADSPASGARPFIEHLMTNGQWSVSRLPDSAGSDLTSLAGLAASDGSVWAAGTYQDQATGRAKVLILRETNGTWTVVNAPGPGAGAALGGITAIGGQLWAAGYYSDGGAELPLIEHHP
jgi:hypothetical protein